MGKFNNKDNPEKQPIVPEYEEQLGTGLSISNLNRREVKKLAKSIANTNAHDWKITNRDILLEKVPVVGKHSRQERRFHRLFNEAMEKNYKRTEDLAMLKAAQSGNEDAMANYVRTKMNDAGQYTYMLPMAGAQGMFTNMLMDGIKGGTALWTKAMAKPAIRNTAEILGFADGIRNTISGDGVQKTIRLAQEGDGWGAVGSGAVDLLDIAGMAGTIYDFAKVPMLSKKNWGKIKNRYNKAFTQNEEYSRKRLEEAREMDKKLGTLTPAEMKFKKDVTLGFTDMPIDPMPKTLTKMRNTRVLLPDGREIMIPTTTRDIVQTRLVQYPTLVKLKDGQTDWHWIAGEPAAWSNKYYNPNNPFDSDVEVRTILEEPRLILQTSMQNVPVPNEIPNKELGIYLDEVQKKLQGRGVIGGSGVLYKDNIISGVPNDIEIITTSKLRPELDKIINYQHAESLRHADSGTSAVAHNSGKTEIQTILSNESGQATGKIAHELYRVLYPEQYAQYIADAVKTKHSPTDYTIDLPLPKQDGSFYTPEELLAEIGNNGGIAKKTLIDALLVPKEYTDKIKYNRPIGILTNINPNIQEQVTDAIKTIGQFTYGSDYKSAKQLYPNLRFDDVEQNKRFLEHLGLDLSLATNPKAMENILEYYHMQLSSSSRIVYPELDVTPTFSWIQQAINSNYAPNGGTVSGGGGNSVLFGEILPLGSHPYRSIAYHPVGDNVPIVNTPMDIVSAYKRAWGSSKLSDVTSKDQFEELRKIIESRVKSNPRIPDDIKQLDFDDYTITHLNDISGRINDPNFTELIGKTLNIRGVYGANYGGRYFGRYSAKPKANRFKIAAPDSGDDYEMGRVLHSYKTYTRQIDDWTGDWPDFKKEIPIIFRQFLDGTMTSHPHYDFFPNDRDAIKQLHDGIARAGKRSQIAQGHNSKWNNLFDQYHDMYLKSKHANEELFKKSLTSGLVGGAAGTIQYLTDDDKKEQMLENAYAENTSSNQSRGLSQFWSKFKDRWIIDENKAKERINNLPKYDK